MTGERHAIEAPRRIDLSQATVAPLLFVLQNEHVPTGIVERPDPGVTIAHTPWYIEATLEYTGGDLVAVLYLMPVDEQTSLLLACLGESFSPMFDLMAGADFGDEVTKLVAQHWPDIYGMLLHSNSLGDVTQRIICAVETVEGPQWAVATPVKAVRNEFPTPEAEPLVIEAVGTFVRVIDPGALPGLVLVLGGPDRMSRRLKAAAGLFSSAGGVLGGIGGASMTDLIRGAVKFVEHARKMREG